MKACSIAPAIRFGIRDRGRPWIACGQLVPAAELGILSNDATPTAPRLGPDRQMAEYDFPAYLGVECIADRPAVVAV